MYIYEAKYNQKRKFYVYQYIRSKSSIHGNEGSPYYVGKGTGNRLYDKEHTVSPPKNKLQIKVISENMNEADAFQLEILLIYFYGRLDLKTGCLLNRTDGGEGFSGVIKSDKTRKLLSEKHKGKIAVYNESKNICKYINKEELSTYENNGYKKGILSSARKNMSTSLKGRKNIWSNQQKLINNGTEELYINIKNISLYINIGYSYGRLPFSYIQNKKRSDYSSNNVWITNGKIENLIQKKFLDNYLKQGFRKGRLKMSAETKNKKSLSAKGKIWISNGIITKFILPKEFQKYEGQGFKKYHYKQNDETKIKKSLSHLGTTIMNDGIKNYCIKKEKINEYIEKGFQLGKLK